jgi:hypothetical protein
LNACKRIDAGAAAVRVYMIGCSDSAEETNADNVASRQLALRGIVEVIAGAQKELQSTADGFAYDNLPLCFFVELVSIAEDALWVALGKRGEGAPCNADLCELLGLALQFHADAKTERPGPAAAATGRAGKGAKGGAA